MNSTNSIKTGIFIFFFLVASSMSAQQANENAFNCYSVLAGKNATADGSVMFAHNEDDWGDRMVNFYKVPQATYQFGEMITMETGAKLQQPKQTWSYLWLEMPEMSFSDSYMNEWGVTIASDACSSREENGELTDGGIGYWLRRAMAERSKSAREAVKIGGALVSQFGYASSGRTYCIADTKEAWMLSVVNGKHWVAKRVPDDEVAIIPNYYTITTINLKDTLNYYGSADLIDYAVKMKWYGKSMGEFNFRDVYSNQDNLKNMGNIVRHWSAINLLSEKQYTVDEPIPFSFKPKQKITLSMLFTVLRNHNEGSEYDGSENYTKGNPHGQDWSICSSTTQYGFVAQLRSSMPVEVGAVLWLAPFRPCVHPFTPWYNGMTELPEGFARGDYNSALTTHFNKIENVKEAAPEHKFFEFVDFAKETDKDYLNRIDAIKVGVKTLEDELLLNQDGFERKANKLYTTDVARPKRTMTEYSIRQVNRSLEMIK